MASSSIETWRENGFLVWRALSGIFCANASGKVSFSVGEIELKDPDKRSVFEVTEIPVLLRNRNVDAVSREMLELYDQCVKRGQAAINLGYLAA